MDCSVWETASGTPEKVRIRISPWSVGSSVPPKAPGMTRSRKYGMRKTPAAVTTPKSDSVIISPYSGPSGLGTGVVEKGDPAGGGSAPGGSPGDGEEALGTARGTASSGTWTTGGGVQVLGSDSGWEASASREVSIRQ